MWLGGSCWDTRGSCDQVTTTPCPKGCKDANEVIIKYFRKELEEHVSSECPGREYQMSRRPVSFPDCKQPDCKLPDCQQPDCKQLDDKHHLMSCRAAHPKELELIICISYLPTNITSSITCLSHSPYMFISLSFRRARPIRCLQTLTIKTLHAYLFFTSTVFAISCLCDFCSVISPFSFLIVYTLCQEFCL